MGLLLSPRFWVAAAVAALLAFTHTFTYRAGKANVRAEWDAQKLANFRAMERLGDKYRDAEVGAAAAVNLEREKADAKIADIHRRYRVELDSLRDRPERPAQPVPGSAVPAPTVNEPAGCTGQGLYRGDAEFLVRFAADAAAVSAALELCKTEYDAVRRALSVPQTTLENRSSE